MIRINNEDDVWTTDYVRHTNAYGVLCTDVYELYRQAAPGGLHCEIKTFFNKINKIQDMVALIPCRKPRN